MDNIDYISKILEEGGQISWRCKYFLMFEENWNSNPDKEWSGYVISQLNYCQYLCSFYKNMNLTETLEEFYNLIDEETRKELNG